MHKCKEFALWVNLHACLRSGVVSASSWQQWFTQNGLVLGAFAVTAVFSVIVLLLLCMHLYLASVNSTTWEFMSRQRIVYLKHCDSEENPFDRGLVCNLWHFCCVCGTVAWERIYIRHSSGTEWLLSSRKTLQSVSLDPTSKVFLLELGNLSQVFCVHCKKSKAEKT